MKAIKNILSVGLFFVFFISISLFAAEEKRLPDDDIQTNGWVTAPLWSKINALDGVAITATNISTGEVSIENPTNPGTYSSVSLEIVARNDGNAANVDLYVDIRINGNLQGEQAVSTSLPNNVWNTYVLTWSGLSFDESDMETLQVLFYPKAEPSGNPQHNPQIDFIEATLTYDVGPNDADLAITKTSSPAPHFFGSDVTFTVTVTNNGPNNATNVEAVDLLGDGFAFVSATPSVGTFNNVTGVWDIGNIDDGVSVTLTIVATILDSGPYENFAEITASDQDDPVPGNNEALLILSPISPPVQVPLTNWALYIGFGLMVVFMVMRFRRSIF